MTRRNEHVAAIQEHLACLITQLDTEMIRVNELLHLHGFDQPQGANGVSDALSLLTARLEAAETLVSWGLKLADELDENPQTEWLAGDVAIKLRRALTEELT